MDMADEYLRTLTVAQVDALLAGVSEESLVGCDIDMKIFRLTRERDHINYQIAMLELEKTCKDR
jgi:hypothetical protein